MRIAMLTSFYDPHRGGTEKYVEDLSSRLVKRGHEVTVFTHTPGDRSSLGDVRIERVPALWLPYTPVLADPVSKRLEEFDVIHSHVPPYVFASGIRPPDGIPHVVTYHCDSLIPDRFRGLPVPGPVRRGLTALLQRKASRSLDRASAVIVTSRDYASSSEVLKNRIVRAIPIGIEPEQYTSLLPEYPEQDGEDREPLFLYVGRLAASKGLDVLLRAAQLLKNYGHPFRLELIGEGEERASLEMMSRKLGLEQYVEFRGRTGRSELVRSMKEARALVLPSVSRLEAFGIVQLEAFCMETPVIASGLPGVRQIVRDTQGGWLVPPGDAVQLYQAMVHVVRNREEAEAAGKRGAAALEVGYNWKTIARQVEDVYLSCLYDAG